MGFPSATQPNNRAALRWVIDQNQIWCGVREQVGALYLGLGLSPASICFNRFGRSFVRMWGRSSPQKLRPPKRPFSWVFTSARFLFRDGGKRRGDMGAGDLSHLISYAYATDQGGREAAGRHGNCNDAVCHKETGDTASDWNVRVVPKADISSLI